jgi:hypothetical protein
MSGRGLLVAAFEHVPEAKRRVPGVGRDDDETAPSGQHMSHAPKQCRLVEEMFKYSDQENEIEAVGAVCAEANGVANRKAEPRMPRGLTDHTGADIDAYPIGDEIREP